MYTVSVQETFQIERNDNIDFSIKSAVTSLQRCCIFRKQVGTHEKRMGLSTYQESVTGRPQLSHTRFLNSYLNKETNTFHWPFLQTLQAIKSILTLDSQVVTTHILLIFCSLGW